MVGGGKVTKQKERTSNIVRGSKLFEGKFVSQFPCFTLKDGELHEIHSIEHITSKTFEFQHILPKDSVLQSAAQVDLICSIPTNNILNRLTKEALSSLPYASADVIYAEVSRKTLIASIEHHLSKFPPDNLYTLFKVGKDRKYNRTVFPKRQENLRVIQESTFTRESEMNTQKATKHEPAVQFDFPPAPVTEQMQHKIISDYCNDMEPCNFHESGCAVCGALTTS